MKRCITALIAVSLLWAGGCGRQETKDTQSDAFDTSRPLTGGVLYRRLDTDVSTLNPVLASTRNDRLVDNYIFTPLVYVDSELRPIPGLAESWDISDDGLRYTFHLDAKARFSDGKPVLASDVLFTLRKIVDPQTEALQLASGFEQLDLTRSRVVDAQTIVIAFHEPLAAQLGQFNNVLTLPEHVYSKGDFKNDYTSSAVGSGPYRLVRREPGKEILLQRRTDYWATQPYADTVVFKVIVNSLTAWNAARRGEVDETMVQSDIWMRERNDPAVLRVLDWRRFYGLSYNYIAWNERDALFADKRVRRALSMSLDVKTIITTIYGGTARPMTGHFLPEQPGYNPNLPVIPFDPPGAKQILASVGWLDTDNDGLVDKGGRPFRFELMIMAGSAPAVAIAQIYQSALKSIGIQMEIAIIDFAVASQRIIAGNYQAAYLSWDLDPDPDPFALFHTSQFPPRGQNLVFYSSPEADRLMDAGRRELTPSKRTAIYQQLDEVLAADQPYTWVLQPSMKWVINRRVQGAKEGKGYGLFLWYPGEFDWWVLPGRRPRQTTGRTGS